MRKKSKQKEINEKHKWAVFMMPFLKIIGDSFLSVSTSLEIIISAKMFKQFKDLHFTFARLWTESLIMEAWSSRLLTKTSLTKSTMYVRILSFSGFSLSKGVVYVRIASTVTSNGLASFYPSFTWELCAAQYPSSSWQPIKKKRLDGSISPENTLFTIERR